MATPESQVTPPPAVLARLNSLLDRIRDNSEAAPWVIRELDEIRVSCIQTTSLAQQGEVKPVAWQVHHPQMGWGETDAINIPDYREKGIPTRPLFTHPAAVDEAMVEGVRKAMRRAFALGQTYWQQADSEYTSQHRKADDTMAKFKALTEETAAALLPAATSEGENNG